jgi:hypothetical protein
MEHITNLAVVGALLIAGSGVGLLVLKALALKGAGRPQQVLLASGLGLGLIGYVPFVLGVSGGLNTPTLLALLLVATAGGVGGWYGFARQAELRLRPEIAGVVWNRLKSLGPIAWVLIGFLTLMGLLNLLAAMAPVIGIDELIYRVRLPELYLDRGEFYYLPTIEVHQQPQQIQMLQMWAMALGSDSGTQIIQWAMGLLLVAAVVDLARRFVPITVALAAGVAFYGVSDVVVLSARAVPDLANGLFLFLAFVAFVRWMDTDEDWWLVVVGVLAGLFAAGSRIPGAYGAIGLAALAILYAWRQPGRGPVRIVAAGAIVGAVALVMVVPWYAKSWALTGNPWWPFFEGIFGARDYNESAAAYSDANQERDVGPWHSVSWILSSPWDLTFNPKKFRSGVLGPFILAAIPLLAVVRVDRRIWYMAAAVVTTGALWYWTFVRLRSFIPVIALMIVIAAYLVWTLWRSDQLPEWTQLSRVARRALAGLMAVSLALWMLFALGTVARFHTDSIVATLTGQDDDEFLAQRLSEDDMAFPWYLDYQVLNETLPPGSSLLIWDTRSYYLDFETERHYLVARKDPFPEGMKDPDYVRARVQELGSDFVVLWPEVRHVTEYPPGMWVEDSLHELCGEEWLVIYLSEKMMVCEVN